MFPRKDPTCSKTRSDWKTPRRQHLDGVVLPIPKTGHVAAIASDREWVLSHHVTKVILALQENLLGLLSAIDRP